MNAILIDKETCDEFSVVVYLVLGSEIGQDEHDYVVYIHKHKNSFKSAYIEIYHNQRYIKTVPLSKDLADFIESNAKNYRKAIFI